jgi:hypothetical protein
VREGEGKREEWADKERGKEGERKTKNGRGIKRDNMKWGERNEERSIERKTKKDK